MNVVVDVTGMTWGNAGVKQYSHHLLRALASSSCDLSLTRTLPPWGNLRQVPWLRKLDTVASDLLWRPFLLPATKPAHKADLVHFLHPRACPVFAMRKPYVVTMHDCYAIKHPDHFSPWEKRLNTHLGPFLQRASAVITVSSYTRKQLLALYPNLDPSRVFAILSAYDAEVFRPAAPEEQQRVRNEYRLDRPYLLFVSTLEPRKNILTLLKAFAETDLGKTRDLILVGGDGWIPDYLRAANQLLAKQPAVRRLGYVPEEDLPGLYSGAEAFAFPSKVEGFGIPVLESMACGCPVVCSTGSSLDEVANGAALQVDPDDQQEWVVALQKLASSRKLRSELSEKGRINASRFSWADTANRVCEVYRFARDTPFSHKDGRP